MKSGATNVQPMSREGAAKMLRDFVEAWNKGDGNGHKLPWGNIFTAIETLEDATPASTDRLAELRAWLNEEEIKAREVRITYQENAPMWHTVNGAVNAYARMKAKIDAFSSSDEKAEAGT